MRFVDEVRIEVRAGKGGAGASSFRREKFEPFGGPDGGDGGRGGSVIIEARSNLKTLLDLRYRRHIRAENGRPGSGRQRTGASGADTIIGVPPGTIVYDDETSEVLADLDAVGARVTAAAGGRGGRGNLRFVSSTNRAPTRYDEGEPGEERILRLELKLLADVGLVGCPNAGKSTLISTVSAARPKIADYPFTTLVPQLGMVRVDDLRSFVMADIPGLIEGAAHGVGLGLQFLRHIERTRILLHLVSVATDEIDSALTRFDVVCDELAAYNPKLLKRPQWVVLTKRDAVVDEDALDSLMERFARRGYPVRAISAVTGAGVRELVVDVARLLEETQEASDPPGASEG